MQMTLPVDLAVVHGRRARFNGWAMGVRGCDAFYPQLDNTHSRSLLDVVLFYQVMSVRGQVQVSERDWPEFISRLTQGLTLGRVQRGEGHVEHLAHWLRARYPVCILHFH